MTSFGNFSVFLCAVGDELRLTKEKEEEEEERRKKKNKMHIFEAWLLDGTKGYADFEGSFAIRKWTAFVWVALSGPSVAFRARATWPYV